MAMAKSSIIGGGIAIAAAILTAVGAAADDAPAPIDWSKSTTVTVSLSDFAFDPGHLVLQHGVPVRLHFANTSKSGHDFHAPAFFKAVTIAPEDQSLVKDGAVDVAAGTSVDLRIVPQTAGKYEVDCSHFMHAMMGMTGDAEID